MAARKKTRTEPEDMTARLLEWQTIAIHQAATIYSLREQNAELQARCDDQNERIVTLLFEQGTA